MNRSTSRFTAPVLGASLLLAALSAAFAADPAPAPSVPQLSVRQQIDALLKARQKPEPLPIDLANPFAFAGKTLREGLVAETTARTDVASVENSATGPAGMHLAHGTLSRNSADVLAACAVRLKIGGIIRLKDQIQVLVNDIARKEGDSISVVSNGAVIQIQVFRLTPGQLVLRYDEAEVTLKY